jgi:hypothetical protein
VPVRLVVWRPGARLRSRRVYQGPTKEQVYSLAQRDAAKWVARLLQHRSKPGGFSSRKIDRLLRPSSGGEAPERRAARLGLELPPPPASQPLRHPAGELLASAAAVAAARDRLKMQDLRPRYFRAVLAEGAAGQASAEEGLPPRDPKRVRRRHQLLAADAARRTRAANIITVAARQHLRTKTTAAGTIARVMLRRRDR